MKDNKIVTLGIFIVFTIASSCETFAQTCDNSGIGTNAPTSKLHIKGCGNTNATSSLHVINSTNGSLLFVRDDGAIGVGLNSPTFKFHINGGGTYGEMVSFQNSTNQTFFVTKASGAGVYNNLTLANDHGIFWKDDETINSANGFVIAPWADGTAKGVRIDGVNGNVGIGTSNSYYKLEAAGDIYANQGSLMVSKSTNEGGSVSVFNHLKTTAGTMIDYVQWNMTGGYGNKYSIWGYPQTGAGMERFSIWDNGEFTFHNTAGVQKIKITNNGYLGIYNSAPTEPFQIGSSIAFHDGGDKLLAFGWAPTPNTDQDAGNYASELRFTPSNGNISFGISSSITTLPVTRMVLDKNGNLGLGTSGPTAALHFKDGHIRSEQTTAPSISVTTQNGITAAALSSGSTDTKGTITTTGDNNGTNTVITVTFNKTCTVSPVVVVSASNASGQAYTFYATAGTTSFTINLKDAGTNATPSFNYFVIE